MSVSITGRNVLLLSDNNKQKADFLTRSVKNEICWPTGTLFELFRCGINCLKYYIPPEIVKRIIFFSQDKNSCIAEINMLV